MLFCADRECQVKNSERAQLLRFLQALPVLQDVTMSECHGLAASIQVKTFPPRALCHAYPAEQSLGWASSAANCVCIIFEGEAGGRVLTPDCAVYYSPAPPWTPWPPPPPWAPESPLPPRSRRLRLRR